MTPYAFFGQAEFVQREFKNERICFGVTQRENESCENNSIYSDNSSINLVCA